MAQENKMGTQKMLPLMFVLSKILGIYGVWVSFPIAEVITCIYSMVVFRRSYLCEHVS